MSTTSTGVEPDDSFEQQARQEAADRGWSPNIDDKVSVTHIGLESHPAFQDTFDCLAFSKEANLAGVV